MDKKYLIVSVLSMVLLFGVGIAWASAEANPNSRGKNYDRINLKEFRGSEVGQKLAKRSGGCGCGCDGSSESCQAMTKKGLESKAQLLGLTTEELQTLLAEGKNMFQIAEERGINLADLKQGLGNFGRKNAGRGCGCEAGSASCLANLE